MCDGIHFAGLPTWEPKLKIKADELLANMISQEATITSLEFKVQLRGLTVETAETVTQSETSKFLRDWYLKQGGDKVYETKEAGGGGSRGYIKYVPRKIETKKEKEPAKKELEPTTPAKGIAKEDKDSIAVSMLRKMANKLGYKLTKKEK